MVSKILATPVALAVGISSIRDLGYKQAKHSEGATAQAQYAIDNMVGFPEVEITPENKAQLFDGYRLRFGENNPGTTYAIINGNYVTATDDMLANKLIDGIIPEPLGGAHLAPEEAAATLKAVIKKELAILSALDPATRITQRIDKFGAMGQVIE